MLVSRSQYCFKVEPGYFRGVYSKPYTGYQRGGQANTPKLVDRNNYTNNLYEYYQAHYDRYNLATYNVKHLNEDQLDPNKMPDDREEVEDEGTAPPVKSGYKPNPVKNKKVVKNQARKVQAPVVKQTTSPGY